MFKSLQRHWGSYDVTSLMDGSVQLISHPGDVFKVNEHLRCKCQVNDGWTPCWQQTHSGLLCNHALRACVHLLKQTENKEDREEIIQRAVDGCDKNWLRSTYRYSKEPVNLPQPIPLKSSMSKEKEKRWTQYLVRFRQVMVFLSPKDVENHLYAMEEQVLAGRRQEQEVGTIDITSPTLSDDSNSVITEVSSTSSTTSQPNPKTRVGDVSNPAKRRRRRDRYIAIVDNDL